MKINILLICVLSLFLGCNKSEPKKKERTWLTPDEFKEAGSPLKAKSFIDQPGPHFYWEEWIGSMPEYEGKFVLLDFWATWCPPCIGNIERLNEFHDEFKDELVIVGVSKESSDVIREFDKAEIKYHLAVDTQARTKNILEVQNIPYAIILDPDGVVRWEGNPVPGRHYLKSKDIKKIIETYPKKKGSA